MPITDSRLKGGTLTLDALSFATQATNVRLEPKTDEVGDLLEVLSGDTVTPDDETTTTLVIELVQDFDDPQGLVAFTWANKGELVPYSWQPNPGAPTYSGTCRVRPVTIGGDVNKLNKADAEFPCTADPTVTYPAV